MKRNLALVLLSLVVISGCNLRAANPPTPNQAVFGSPRDAFSALVNAAKAADRDRLAELLGPDSEELLASGDSVADRASMARFYDLYAEKSGLKRDGDDRFWLVLGDRQWSFPIPLVLKTTGWLFDAEAGKNEILNRRIGRNELWVIDASHAYVDAQKRYFSADHDGDGIREYAQVIISDPGLRNGLYWERSRGEAPSPLGPLIAQTITDGYRPKVPEERTAVHGYLYKVLTAQGENAPGGKKSYLTADGQLTRGFALIAYPAVWGNSGAMTFIVAKDGQVFQKDLGKNSTRLAESMTEYNPDSTWIPVK